MDYYSMLNSGERNDQAAQGQEQHDQQHQEQQEQQQQPRNQDRIDRSELRRIATMDLDFINRFPTPPSSPVQPANLPYAPSGLIYKPRPELLDTAHIPDDAWYYVKDQYPPHRSKTNYKCMSDIEKAYVLNNLRYNDALILTGYRKKFEKSPTTDAEVQRLIDDARWKAKEKIWVPAEIDILREAADQGDTPEQAFDRLHGEWLYYPKTYQDVYNKYMDVCSGVY